MSAGDGQLTITLRFFAQLRQAAGAATVVRVVPPGTTAGDLAATILRELSLEGLAGSIVLAIDAEFADPATPLHDGAWLSMIPPVSGGAPEADLPAPVVEVVVTEAPLDPTAALASMAHPGAGGTVLFQGTPRDVDALEFEAHHELAIGELGRIGAELAARHGLHGIALHHRLGRVPATEAALVVVAASAHRGPAFTAAREALDVIKARVPIWKSEAVGEVSTLVEGQTVTGVPTVGDHLGAEASGGVARATPDGGSAAPGPSAAWGNRPPARLTHVAADGSARMVDVSDKAVTDRQARAVATVRVSPATAALIAEGNMPKGEVLSTARLAGILAAKRTAELVPLAHPLPLTKIDVEATVDAAAGIVQLEGFARTTGKTGVEIEALTAVLIAALTVYDMVKAVEQHASIEGVRVVEKTGGRRDFGPAAAPGAEPSPGAAGATPHDGSAPDAGDHLHGAQAPHAPGAPHGAPPLVLAAVHVSTSRTAGTAPDRSRGALADFAARTGWTVAHEVMVSDEREAIAEALLDALAAPGVEVVLTLGGTGLTSDDVTPDATASVIDREIPGLADALRAVSLGVTPLAALSRGIAGAAGDRLVVNLPGSPKALAELEPLLSAVLPHAVSQLRRSVKG